MPFYLLGDQWDFLHSLADKREADKRSLKSSRLLRGEESTHFIGLVGEYVYALHTGQLLNQDFYEKAGDAGFDFPDGTDVKTSTNPRPYLKVPVNSRLPDFLALVWVSETSKIGSVVGKVTRADFVKYRTKMRFSQNKDYPLDWVLTTAQVVRLNVLRLTNTLA
jgi:hypothetical protein